MLDLSVLAKISKLTSFITFLFKSIKDERTLKYNQSNQSMGSLRIFSDVLLINALNVCDQIAWLINYSQNQMKYPHCSK